MHWWTPFLLIGLFMFLVGNVVGYFVGYDEALKDLLPEEDDE